MQVVKETNELSKKKGLELQELINQLNNEMAVELREAAQYCAGDKQCQKEEYDRIRQEFNDKFNSYRELVLDGTDWQKIESQYYPDNTKIKALWEGIKDAPGKWGEGVIDSAGKAIRYIDDNTLNQIGSDAWEFGKKIAQIPMEWFNKEIPADSFETALTELSSMTGHDVGEATFYNVAGVATASLGGKTIQWIGGKWVKVEGIAKAGKGETNTAVNDVAGTIRGVNPGYPIEGRTHNCVNCAIATDATLGGNPASALPINSKNGVPISVLEKQFGTKFQNVSGHNNIIEQMSNAGPGARGVVFGSYGPGQPGHVFNVVNQNGKIRFLDGQTGKAADISKFKSFKFLRTN
ncbi:toxin glutamine deamidase domain-containing protein [Gilliamella sp. App4-10]|uniref:toxin glutamine deamidase domain-containing protein n=1 Tax=Gilliamella sp. App4-10 TaxID=3120231 RepID=UPI00080E7A21|nr:toxin glutamine deamidase domain-containing protein [Gilliamella apicola]OCG22604.1 hypothetical protein A9G23_02935 [Gilliamella apicola]